MATSLLEQKALAREEWRRHWPLVLAAAFAFSFTSVMTASTGLFIDPWTKEFGWSRTLLSSGMSITSVTTPDGASFSTLAEKYAPT